MEYKIMTCDGCQNIHTVKDTQDPVYICPICGCINRRNTMIKYIGNVGIESPELTCHLEGVEEGNDGIISIPDEDEELTAALMTLVKYGWSLKFRGKKLTDEFDEEDEYDDEDDIGEA